MRIKYSDLYVTYNVCISTSLEKNHLYISNFSIFWFSDIYKMMKFAKTDTGTGKKYDFQGFFRAKLQLFPIRNHEMYNSYGT